MFITTVAYMPGLSYLYAYLTNLFKLHIAYLEYDFIEIFYIYKIWFCLTFNY